MGSFPSGHIDAAVTFWGILAIDLRAETRRTRADVGGAIVMVVALTRVFLGAHWIEEVVVGAAIGPAFVVAMYYLRERSREPLFVLYRALAGLVVFRLAIGPSESAAGGLALAAGVLVALWVDRETPVTPEIIGIIGRQHTE